MKKTGRKLFSWLLVFALVFTLMPGVAFATGEDVTIKIATAQDVQDAAEGTPTFAEGNLIAVTAGAPSTYVKLQDADSGSYTYDADTGNDITVAQGVTTVLTIDGVPKSLTVYNTAGVSVPAPSTGIVLGANAICTYTAATQYQCTAGADGATIDTSGQHEVTAGRLTIAAPGGGNVVSADSANPSNWVVRDGVTVTLNGVTVTGRADSPATNVAARTDGGVALTNPGPGEISLAAGKMLFNSNALYTAGADGAKMTLSPQPHTLTDGSVTITGTDGTSGISGTQNYWYIAPGKTATLNGVTLTAGTAQVELRAGDTATASSITGDLTALKITGADTTATVGGNVGQLISWDSTSTSASAVTINGTLGTSENTKAFDGDNSSITVKAYEVKGNMWIDGANPTATHFEIGPDSATAVKFALHQGNADDEIEASFKDNTLTITRGDGTAGYVKHEGTGAVDYDVILEKGAFDANNKNITGDVTFNSTTMISEVRSANIGYEVFGKITFEDNAKGFVNMLVRTDTGGSGNHEGIYIGDDAYAKFSFVNLTTAAQYNANKANGTAVHTLGDGATVELANTGSTRGLASELIAAVGTADAVAGTYYGDNVKFILPNAAVIYAGSAVSTEAPFSVADRATVTITHNETAEAGILNNAITVGRGAHLTLSGDATHKLNLGQGGNGITLKNGFSNDAADRTKITFNRCDANDGAAPDLNKLCFKEGGYITIEITNTDLDDILIEAPETSDGEDDGEDDGYLRDSFTYTPGVTWSVLEKDGVRTNTFSHNNRDIAELTDEGKGSVRIVVYADSPYRIGDILSSHGTDILGSDTIEPGEDYTITKVGGVSLQFEFEPIGTEVGGGKRIDTDVTFNDPGASTGDPYYHYNHFVVAENKTMRIILGQHSGISGNSTFELGENSTLIVSGSSISAEFRADIDVKEDDVTIILDGIKMVGHDSGGTNENDAMIDVAAGADGARLIIAGDTSISAVPGADWDSAIGASTNNASNPHHEQSVAIRNKGELTIEVPKGVTLSAIGGAAEGNRLLDELNYGGAGLHNTGELTFKGEGVIMLTGGMGGFGHIGTTGANASANNSTFAGDGGKGGPGGFGLYNNGGEVNVAMTSESWAQGQFVVTGGQGGKGGKGGTSGLGWHTSVHVGFHDNNIGNTGCQQWATATAGDGGNGGNSGGAVYTGSSFNVNSGVFLSYSGTGGVAGDGGDVTNQSLAGVTIYCTNGTNTQSSHGSCNLQHTYAGGAGDPGVDTNTYAITGDKMTVNGGTTYAFGGAGGGNLTDMEVNGGSIFGGVKNSVGYEDSNAHETTMVPTNTNSGFSITNNVTNKAGTPAGFTRIKTGTETYKYLVEKIEVKNNGNPVSYGGGNTGMYANEQGFLYVYLPDINNPAKTDTATLYLKQDGADVRYKLHCGGNVNATGGYGYGDVYGDFDTRSQINYDGKAVWGEEFQITANGPKYYNGVDMGAVDVLLALTHGGANGAPYSIDTPEKLAALAYAVNSGERADGFLHEDGIVDFRLDADLNMARLAWTPIGTDVDRPFKGQLRGTKNQAEDAYDPGTLTTIKGLRMASDYDDGIFFGFFGLFGYTDGAIIEYIKIDGSEIAGTPYAKTLPTNNYGETSLATTSGGEYDWAVSDMHWKPGTGSTATFMGAIAGMANDGSITNCEVTNMTVQPVGGAKAAALGGIVGVSLDVTITNCNVTDTNLALQNPSWTIEIDGETVTNTDAVVGGIAGVASGGKISGTYNGADSNSHISGVNVTADSGDYGTAYAGGVAGYLVGTTVSNIDLGGYEDNVNKPVSVTAIPGDAEESEDEEGAPIYIYGETYAGGVAGHAENATIKDFVWATDPQNAGRLDRMTITAQADTENTKAYAGGVCGASIGTTYDKVVFGGQYSTVTANNYSTSDSDGSRYAGGAVANSTGDVFRDVSVVASSTEIKAYTGTDSYTTDNTYVGGLAAETDGSKFYRCFVRAVKLGGNDKTSLIWKAVDTTMAGCYAQGVTSSQNDDQVSAAIGTSKNSTFISCYNAPPSDGDFLYVNEKHGDTVCYNCYLLNETAAEGDAAMNDEEKPLDAATLKAAIGVLNAELMSTQTNGNDSGFNCLAEFGEPIMYKADETVNINGGYPIHGECVLVTINVTKGAGYAEPVLLNDSGVYLVSKTPAQVRYYVEKGIAPKLGYTSNVNLNASHPAEYVVSNDLETEPNIDFVSGGTNLSAVSNNTNLNVEFIPVTYTYYTLDLKAGNADSHSARSGAVTLNGTVVHRYTNTGAAVDPDEPGTPDDDTRAIQTLILTVDNGATLSGLPAAWAGYLIEGAKGPSYYHYNFSDQPATAAEVEEALQGVSVTPGSGTGKYNVSAYIYESPVGLLTNYGGHFYQYVPGSYTWAQAYNNAQAVTPLGAANSYLATVTSAGENDYLYGKNGLNAQNAWMGAVSSNQKTSIPGLKVGTAPGWYWVSGPEAGTQFMYAVTGETNVVSGQYAKWASGEPNNSGNSEWAAGFAYGGQNYWNDFDGASSYGYIVEFMAKEGGAAGSVYANDLFTYTKEPSGGSRPPGPGGTGGTGGTETPPVTPEPPATPIDPADPTETGVANLLNYKDHIAFMEGYPDGDFRPGGDMTRAEAAQMFYNLLINKNVPGDSEFPDVEEAAWYYEAVITLANLGIVEGTEDGTFAPRRSITRQEFVAMALRFADHMVGGVREFSDVPEIHWAYEYIMSATGYGWINGYEDGTFRPKGTITRVEAAAVVNRMLARSADKAYVDAHRDDLHSFPDVPMNHWAYYEVAEATNAHEYTKSGSKESWTE